MQKGFAICGATQEHCYKKSEDVYANMEIEVALQLLQRFLEKRNVDCIKQLSGLVTFGRVQGFFKDPNSLFALEEWRKFGDKLWDLVIDEDKTAKKLMKPWREVANEIQRYQVEKKVAAVPAEQLGGGIPTPG